MIEYLKTFPEYINEYRTGNLMVIIKLSLMISVIVIIKINANIKINS